MWNKERTTSIPRPLELLGELLATDKRGGVCDCPRCKAIAAGLPMDQVARIDYNAHKAQILDMLKEVGICYFPCVTINEKTQFFHSIGMTDLGHPEVLYVSQAPGGRDATGQVAAMYTKFLQENDQEALKAFHEDFIGLDKGFVFVDVDPVQMEAAGMFPFTEVHYEGKNKTVSYKQLVFRDNLGMFPWDSKYSGQIQPVVGEHPKKGE